MNIEFLSTVAVITPDPPVSRKLYLETIGPPHGGTSISTASRLPVANPSGSGRCHRPLKRASGPRIGQPTGRPRRSISSSTLPTPQQSAQRHASSIKRATSYCTHGARSRGVKRWPGCSHRRAQPSVSRISRRSTSTNDLASDLLYQHHEHLAGSGLSLGMRGTGVSRPRGIPSPSVSATALIYPSGVSVPGSGSRRTVVSPSPTSGTGWGRMGNPRRRM
jgi:hypothetical protein